MIELTETLKTCLCAYLCKKGIRKGGRESRENNSQTNSKGPIHPPLHSNGQKHTFKQHPVEALMWSKHWKRKALSRTASKYHHCERIKLIRYRNPRDMELDEFQQENKGNQEERWQSR